VHIGPGVTRPRGALGAYTLSPQWPRGKTAIEPLLPLPLGASASGQGRSGVVCGKRRGAIERSRPNRLLEAALP